MAMLPFCGYNMADYFAHWLATGRREGVKLPRIYYVNWFRKGENGKFLWPGFGENSRVLAWIFRRLDGDAEAVETPIGLVPPVGAGGIETEGLDISRQAVEQLLEVDRESWLEQLPQIEEHYARFGEKLPRELRAQLDSLERRLRA
jgi:phosphoenolpyruvate carboxykinase (GTP)